VAQHERDGVYVPAWPPAQADSPLLEPTSELLRQTPHLVHMSLVVRGDRAFSIDYGGPDVAEARGVIAQGVVGSFRELNSELQLAPTGALTRLVLETSLGAVFAYSLAKQSHLIGFFVREGAFPTGAIARGAASEIREVDRAIAALTEQARDSYLADGRDLAEVVDAAHSGTVASPAEEIVVTGTADARITPLCRRSIDEYLHYVFYAGSETVAFGVDGFERLQLPRVYVDTSPARLRRIYRGVGTDLEGDLRDLRRLIYPVIGRGSHSIILGLEYGALAMRWLSSHRLLLGLTLLPDRSADFEERFAGLASIVERAYNTESPRL
jgi:hypothetical protein